MPEFATREPAWRLHAGHLPLLVSMPHVGTHLPDGLSSRLTDAACRLPDTDWHLERLYDFALALGASVLVATHSRYVVDLNRPPDGASLYPGQSVTGLCPLDTFDLEPLYTAGTEPDAAERARRVQDVWQPYHDALTDELARLRARHGVALLWDAHSIRSVVPRFFAGRLTDLNLGTADGASCSPVLAATLLQIAQSQREFSAVLNGRFKGGHITRHYGDPARRVHAVQLELTQCAYMQEQWPYAYLPERAVRVQPLLHRLLLAALDFAQSERGC
jgi:N-formylglutamate deformylase